MMTFGYRTFAAAVFMAFVLPVIGSATAKSAAPFEKKYHESFNVAPDAVVQVANKFGKVHVNTWDKTEVTVDVVISIDVKDQAEADKVFSNITIKIDGSKDLVTATTVFKSKWKNKNNQLSIDYTVNAPRKASMDLTNRFGDIYTGDLEGPVTIDLQYGSMRLGELNNKNNRINLQFTEGNVAFMALGNVDVQYSEMDIEKAGGLIVKSQFSELNIGPAAELEIDSQYDEVDIEGVAKLKMDIQFGELEVKLVSRELTLVSAYSEVDVKMVSPDFEHLFIDNQFGDVFMGLRESASYTLDAEGSFGDIKLPQRFKAKEKSIKTTSWKYIGVVGEESPKAHVSVLTSYGDVDLK